MTSPNQTNLITDFRRILELFDKETKIYKEQISILKQAVAELQTNDAIRINEMSKELNELRSILTNLDRQQKETCEPINEPAINKQVSTSETRNIYDYLCQICLDKPRDCILEPCMHFCLCSTCVRLLTESKCPICRRPVEFFQNVFIS